MRCFNSPPNYKDFFASLTMSANQIQQYCDSLSRQQNVTHSEQWRVVVGYLGGSLPMSASLIGCFSQAPDFSFLAGLFVTAWVTLLFAVG